MNNLSNKISKNIYINIDGTVANYNVVSYKEINSIDYFSELRPNIPFINALKDFAINNPVRIYLIVPYFQDMKHCLIERKHWINENIPYVLKKHIVYVPIGQNIYESINIEQYLSTDTLYLLDDYLPNLRKWEIKNENMKSILYLNENLSINNPDMLHEYQTKYQKPVFIHSDEQDCIYRQLKKIFLEIQ